MGSALVGKVAAFRSPLDQFRSGSFEDASLTITRRPSSAPRGYTSCLSDKFDRGVRGSLARPRRHVGAVSRDWAWSRWRIGSCLHPSGEQPHRHARTGQADSPGIVHATSDITNDHHGTFDTIAFNTPDGRQYDHTTSWAAGTRESHRHHDDPGPRRPAAVHQRQQYQPDLPGRSGAQVALTGLTLEGGAGNVVTAGAGRHDQRRAVPITTARAARSTTRAT